MLRRLAESCKYGLRLWLRNQFLGLFKGLQIRALLAVPPLRMHVV
jgi:hypothetical protein